MSEWKPIETAPLISDPAASPESVLLWVKDGGDLGKGACAFGFCYRATDGRIRARANGYWGDFEITHWMPLPESPE